MASTEQQYGKDQYQYNSDASDHAILRSKNHDLKYQEWWMIENAEYRHLLF